MIVGIDFSLTGTGVCIITDGEAECLTIGSRARENWWEAPERVRGIARSVALLAPDPPAWAIESPSFMSKGRGHDQVLVGWWFLIDELVRVHGWEPPVRVAPAQVKKWATGKGGGKGTSKIEVALAIAKKHPDVQIRNDNEADAVALAGICAALHKEPFTRNLTKPQQEVVDAIVGGKEER